MGRYSKTRVIAPRKKTEAKRSRANYLNAFIVASTALGAAAIIVDPQLPKNVQEFPSRLASLLSEKQEVPASSVAPPTANLEQEKSTKALEMEIAKLNLNMMLRNVLREGFAHKDVDDEVVNKMADTYSELCVSMAMADEPDRNSQIERLPVPQLKTFPPLKDHMPNGTGNNFSSIANNFTGSIGMPPSLVSNCAYLIGVHMAVQGVLKIKDHVENPTQTPLKNGAIRLAADGALFALPTIVEKMQNIIDGTNVSAAKLSKVKFAVK